MGVARKRGRAAARDAPLVFGTGGVVGSIGVVHAVVGLVGAGLLRCLPARGRVDGLTAAGYAAVRGGSKAALVVVVVELHLAGVLDVDRHGRLRRVVHVYPKQDATPLHRAARTVYSRTMFWADAAANPAVLRARTEVQRDLVRRGLRCGPLRLAAASLLTAAGGTAAVTAAHGALWTGPPLAALSLGLLLAPARTLAGHRLLRELRRSHPLPATAAPGAGEAGLLTALHGRRALRLLLPAFAAQAALFGGRAARESVARDDHGPTEGSGHAVVGDY